MKKVSKTEVKRQVYGAISAWLRGECRVDTDDTDFHEIAWPLQEKIADDFDRKAERLTR